MANTHRRRAKYQKKRAKTHRRTAKTHRRTAKTHRRKVKKTRGGGMLSGVVSALKTALPSIVLYEALRMKGKNRKTKKSKGKKRGRR